MWTTESISLQDFGSDVNLTIFEMGNEASVDAITFASLYCSG